MTTKIHVVSGIQPSGKLHVGNYLGAVSQFIDTQAIANGERFFFIADLHSLSEDFKPEQKKAETYDLLASLLALGLDQKKSTIFLQSHIAGHTDLAWLFSTVIPVAELERMTQYKDKASRQKANINAALLTYPILQAADILLYKGQSVPVGQDQEQHLELARIIAKKMNNRFDTDFPLPVSLPPHNNRINSRVMSLKDPKKKMSKSLGDQHVINIFDEPKIIEEKIKRAVTSSEGKEGSSGGDNLFGLLESFKNDDSIVKKYRSQFIKGNVQFSELKKSVSVAIISFFSKSRKRYLEMREDKTYLDTVFDMGRKKAQSIATATLNETKQKMGLL